MSKSIYDMRVNHLDFPLGFDLGNPVFTWKGYSGQYRLLLARDEKMSDIVYDSGMTGLNPLCTCPKIPLVPRTRYYWSVTGAEGESGQAWFETSKMEEPWAAKWIGCDRGEPRHPVFSKKLDLTKPVLKARLYICGLGLYEVFIDGKRVSEELFTPYCSDYNSWVQYQTYDITPHLKESSVLSVLLGNGWYGGRFGFSSKPGGSPYYGDDWKLIAEIRVTFADGSESVYGTDESWTVTRSRITFSNIYDGERADETLPELKPTAAETAKPPKGELLARLSVPVTVHEELPVKEIVHTPAGETVLDIGQNIAGIFRMRVKIPAGERLVLQFGEILQQGNFYRDNLRTAQARYEWVSDGQEHVLSPHFTWFGYRYVKVEGTQPALEDFTALAVYSQIPAIGQLRTGNELVNRLILNTMWGQKDNFLDVPTDCPQRDERMGWTGDAQVFAPTACYLTDCTGFFHKYLTDMNREQAVLDGAVPNVIPSFGMDQESSTAWGDAAVRIPWTIYCFSGDEQFLDRHYEGMAGWVNWCAKEYDAGRWLTQFHFGDWLALDGAGGADSTLGGTDEAFIALAYLIESTRLTQQAAKILGKEEDSLTFSALRERLLKDLHQEYFSPSGRCCIDTQTAHLLTLAFALSDKRGKAADALGRKLKQSNGELRTGFVGTPLLCPTLSELGRYEDAYNLLLNEDYPGWLYEVKLGATTVWERWNSVLEDGSISSTGMNSLNHYSYGSIVEWMWRWAAGIEAVTPGFKEVKIHPVPDWRLRTLDAVYDSVSGRYEVHWNCVDERHLTVRVTVPYGCTAHLTLPYAPESAYPNGEILEEGSYEFCYETVQPLRRIFSTSMPLGELLEEKVAHKILSRMFPGIEQVPASMRSMTFREAARQLAGDSINDAVLDHLDEILAGIV